MCLRFLISGVFLIIIGLLTWFIINIAQWILPTLVSLVGLNRLLQLFLFKTNQNKYEMHFNYESGKWKTIDFSWYYFTKKKKKIQKSRVMETFTFAISRNKKTQFAIWIEPHAFLFSQKYKFFILYRNFRFWCSALHLRVLLLFIFSSGVACDLGYWQILGITFFILSWYCWAIFKAFSLFSPNHLIL